MSDKVYKILNMVVVIGIVSVYFSIESNMEIIAFASIIIAMEMVFIGDRIRSLNK